jgi:hypothetical protein
MQEYAKPLEKITVYKEVSYLSACLVNPAIAYLLGGVKCSAQKYNVKQNSSLKSMAL